MVATEQQIRRVYRNQRQQTDPDARLTVDRLVREYERFLAGISRELDALQAVAEGNLSTRDLLHSAALARLQEQIRTGLIPLQNLVGREAERLQQAGIADGRAIGVDNLALVLSGQFNRVPLAQLQALIHYVDMPAFQARWQGLGQYHADYLSNIILADDAQGRNPALVARHIVQYLRGQGLGNAMPLADAVRMTRTAQLYASRRATQMMYEANQDVVQGWYWSAALDIRTCPACFAMHGTFHPVSEILNDHFMGRCAAMPATSLVQAPRLGTSIFEDLPMGEQQTILGRSAWAAWRDGQFNLSDIVGIAQDEVYGPMRHARSLQDMIGVDAARAYRRNAA